LQLPDFQKIEDVILKECAGQELTSKFAKIMGTESHQLGLLLSERLLNIPYELVPPLYDALFDEVAQAGREEMLVPDNKRSFSFKYYLVMSSIYHEKEGKKGGKGIDLISKAEKNKAETGHSRGGDTIYAKLEDEIFRQVAYCSSTFKCKGERAEQYLAETGLVSHKLVMLVPASSIAKFRKELAKMVGPLPPHTWTR